MEDERLMEKRAAMHDGYLFFPRPYFQVPSDKRARFSEHLITEAAVLISNEAPQANPDTISAPVTAYDQSMVLFEAAEFDKPAFEASIKALSEIVQKPENLASWQVTLVAGETAYEKLVDEEQD